MTAVSTRLVVSMKTERALMVIFALWTSALATCLEDVGSLTTHLLATTTIYARKTFAMQQAVASSRRIVPIAISAMSARFTLATLLQDAKRETASATMEISARSGRVHHCLELDVR